VRFGVADDLSDTTNADCGGGGKASETLMQVLSLHCKQAAGQGAGTEQRSSMVLLKPITGRSHQLRVHLQFLGHPIQHDRLYCPEAVARARAGGDDGVDPAGLLKLHAFRLYFRHPISAAPMSITALCVDGSVNKETSTPFVSIDDLSIDGELLQRGIDVLMQ
jgi:23S rRNA-/tRNA-specific pseudouridylate synthase